MIKGPLETLKRARQLRGEMSLPEVLLWKELRKRPGEFKFRRQHPTGNYILDFYCAAVRLAIEVDGFAHDSIEGARKDEARSHFLRSQHIATLRVPAKALLEDIEAAVIRIAEVCNQRAERLREKPLVPLHYPADGPPPRSGEDL
jgi:very-short-patch-repair endonuclease